MKIQATFHKHKAQIVITAAAFLLSGFAAALHANFAIASGSGDASNSVCHGEPYVKVDGSYYTVEKRGPDNRIAVAIDCKSGQQYAVLFRGTVNGPNVWRGKEIFAKWDAKYGGGEQSVTSNESSSTQSHRARHVAAKGAKVTSGDISFADDGTATVNDPKLGVITISPDGKDVSYPLRDRDGVAAMVAHYKYGESMSRRNTWAVLSQVFSSPGSTYGRISAGDVWREFSTDADGKERADKEGRDKLGVYDFTTREVSGGSHGRIEGNRNVEFMRRLYHIEQILLQVEEKAKKEHVPWTFDKDAKAEMDRYLAGMNRLNQPNQGSKGNGQAANHGD